MKNDNNLDGAKDTTSGLKEAWPAEPPAGFKSKVIIAVRKDEPDPQVLVDSVAGGIHPLSDSNLPKRRSPKP